MSGFISFVSAGPGDPELLTLKAVNRLRQADAILYDDRASGPILREARAGADLVGVGKKVGRASPRQAHVSRLLIDYAMNGSRVVRLKSGDAGLFGRLEEELTAVHEAGIEYEIVPGVPSACAAAALYGIPLTRRMTARRVQFVTGHDIHGQLPTDLHISALADPSALTVVFMGKRTFPQLAEKLMAAGLPGSTPALLADSVSLPEEAFFHTTLSDLATRMATEPGDGPGLILYGALEGIAGQK